MYRLKINLNPVKLDQTNILLDETRLQAVYRMKIYHIQLGVTKILKAALTRNGNLYHTHERNPVMHCRSRICHRPQGAF